MLLATADDHSYMLERKRCPFINTFNNRRKGVNFILASERPVRLDEYFNGIVLES